MKWASGQMGNALLSCYERHNSQTLGREYVSDGVPFLRAENLLGETR